MYIPPRPSPPQNRSHCQDECPLSATGPPASEPPRRWPRGMLQLEQCLGSDSHKESPKHETLTNSGPTPWAATLFWDLVPGIAPPNIREQRRCVREDDEPKGTRTRLVKDQHERRARDYKRGKPRCLSPGGMGRQFKYRLLVVLSLSCGILPESSSFLVFRFPHCFL